MSYNTFDLTREAVSSALAAAEGLSHEVIVVDNNSPDGSGSRLLETYPPDGASRVTVLQNTENRGFSAANNQGASAAEGSVLYFLNSDTVSHPGSIRALFDFLQGRQGVGAVGPRVLNPDGTDQPSTSTFLSTGRIIRHLLPLGTLVSGRDRRVDFIPASTEPVDIVKGCALALKRDVFDDVGGWDESYFMYAEETELCRKLVDAGYVNYYCREAEIMHYGGASTGREDFVAQQLIHARSATQYLKRHHGPGTIAVHRAAGCIGFAGRAALFRLLSVIRPKHAAEYRKRREAASALWRWFLREYPG